MSSENKWKYYNHAVIPTIAPHEIPDVQPIMDGSIWKSGGGYSASCKMDNRF